MHTERLNNQNRKERLVRIFNDTIRRIDFSENLTDSVLRSIGEQQYYLGSTNGSLIAGMQDGLNKETVVTVSQKRTFEAASDYVYSNYNKKVAVLNFASATTPGGGVAKGASAQEECLCRVSTLYPCLKAKKAWDLFYAPHRKEMNPLHNDDIIYTPNVVVIKDDDYNLLQKPFAVDVITCAAPNLREMPSNGYNTGDGNNKAKISENELFELHKTRATKILFVALNNNVDVLVLGAFGCGAFKNPPSVVANAYAEVLSKYAKHFERIEFAVYCPSSDKSNYEAFKVLENIVF